MYTCETCDAIESCKRAFGRYWQAKSANGVGCGYKFPQADAKCDERKSKPKTVKTLIVEKTLWENMR